MLIDVFAGQNRVYLADRDNVIFNAPNLTFPRRKNPDEGISKTLLDGVCQLTFFEVMLKICMCWFILILLFYTLLHVVYYIIY